MSETSLSQNVLSNEDTNICEANNEVKEEELKDVETDMELLELQDSEVNDAILFEFKPMNIQTIPSSPSLGTKNRRYTLRPKKRPETTKCDNYTSTNIRNKSATLSKNGCLETIFENPVLKSGSLKLLGQKRLKRYLSFDTFVSKTKLKQRKLKLKRLGKGKKKNKTSCKVTVEDVMLKLKKLEDDDDVGGGMEVQE